MAGSRIVLLHGSLLGPWSWDHVRDRLSEQGHTVLTPTLPFEALHARSTDHLAEIQAAVRWSGSDKLVFVAHSMAGLLTPALARRWPRAEIIYLAGLLPYPERSLIDQLDSESEMFTPGWSRWGAPPPWEDHRRAEEFLFHDLQPGEAATAAAQITPDSSALALERAPVWWPPLPSTYIRPVLDRTIDPRWMRAAADTRLGVDTIDISSGHCPQLACPRLVADLLASLTREADDEGSALGRSRVLLR